MERLDKKERKEIFFNILSPYFKDSGFKKYLTGMDPGYVFHDAKRTIHLFYNFKSDNTITGGSYNLTFYEIENYILKIGIPTNELVEQKKKEKYHIITVFQNVIPESIKPRKLESSVEIKEFAYAYLDFYKNEGNEFLKKYESIDSILIEMDRLRSQGFYWKEVLYGEAEHLIKGLIVSKLLKDSDYQNKFKWVADIFESANNEWFPYWLKYKNVLNEI